MSGYRIMSLKEQTIRAISNVNVFRILLTLQYINILSTHQHF